MQSSSSLVTQALQTARYNEIVQLTIKEDETDEEQARIVSLVAGLDPQNGGIQWSALPDDPQRVLSRHLQTKRWIFPMLNDHRRNRLYEQAIEKAVEHLAEQFEKNPTGVDTIHGLDVGSGTGLLGMIVARQLRETFGKCKNIDLNPKFKVTSIEMASSMAQIARQTIHDNGLSEVVHVVEGHSCELPPITPPAQLCVSELLESGLLGEGILPALRDAWERHMQSSNNAVMIPQRARVYAQLVQSGQSDWISNYYGPHNNQIAQIFNQICSETTTPPRFSLDSDGSQRLLDAQAVVVPIHACKLFRDQSLIALSNPIQILDFDFVQRLSPSTNQESRSITCTATNHGVAQGIVVWWELDLWKDSSLTYSMDPHGQKDWQDHWHQCLHVLPRCRRVSPGDSLSIQVSHTDYRIAIGLDDDNNKSALQDTTDSSESSSNKRPRIDIMATTSSLISPERAFQLNDTERLSVWTRSIAQALKEKGSDALVLDVSDFCWCACLAASLGATKVVSVESGSSAELAARVAQLANGFPRESTGSRFDILQCHTEHLTLDALGGTPAQIVMAEYYQVLEGWHFQEALNFYFIVCSLRARQLISRTAKVLPACCRIMACAIESSQLRSAYAACGDTEEDRLLGFDHSCINRLGSNFFEYDLSLPMWQYDYSRLTESFELATLHFQDCNHTDMNSSFSTKSTFTSKGSVDAVMIWLEYNFPSSTDTWVYSTSGQSSRQLVRMLRQPIVIDENNARDAKLVCNFAFSCGPDQGLQLETVVET